MSDASSCIVSDIPANIGWPKLVLHALKEAFEGHKSKHLGKLVMSAKDFLVNVFIYLLFLPAFWYYCANAMSMQPMKRYFIFFFAMLATRIWILFSLNKMHL